MQSRKFLHKRRGQALVLYALLIPVLFLFVGAGIDLGWYFLNVSRLQNAADAAALAGAWELVSVDEDYWPVALSKPPTDLEEYNTFYVWNSTTGKYEKHDITVREDGQESSIAESGRAEAILYANKNLISVVTTDNDAAERTLSKTAVSNEWIAKNNLRNVEIETTLYAKSMDIEYEGKYDSDNKNGSTNYISSKGTKYYKVTLTEKISHLFLSNLDPMNAIVVSYVMLTPHDKSLVESIKPLEETKTIHNWEYQKKYRNFTGNWNHYRQTINGAKKVKYEEGDNFRTETLSVTPDKSKSSAVATEANGGYKYDMDDTDSINIDFNQDFKVKKYVDYDWDLRSPKDNNIEYINMEGWNENHGYDLRIQGLINFNGAWDNRKLKDSTADNDLDADIMWTRIESDPMWSKDVAWGNQDSLNSVHQMIINAHASNAKVVDTGLKDSDGNPLKAYEKRPFFIFYMGPEINEPNNTNNVRKSQPVILNLYEDWNAILYMPNSPVIINGNGHKLTGSVIAKEYHRLKEDSDFLREGYIQATDAYDHTIFVKDDDHLITEEDLDKIVADNEYTKAVDKGYVSLYEKTSTHLIIDARHVKGLSGYEDEYIKTLKAHKNITDAETVKITFPEDKDTFGGYVNTATYTVAKKDLSATQKDGYVAVLVEGETTPQYIAKTNLPYVRVYRKSSGDLYPYVPVCDLRVKTTAANKYETAGGSNPYGYAGVTLADDDHDAYADGKLKSDMAEYKIDEKMDTWKVERKVLESNSDCYQNIYKEGKILKTVDNTEGRYFIIKTEKVAEYTKLIMPNGDIKYVKEEPNAYYVKIVPDGATGKNASGQDVENPIIIDNKGDLQSVALDVSEVTRAPKDPEEIPKDRGTVRDGKYRRTSTASRDKDYRIPAYEVVYKAKEAFNLSTESCYSYFHIDELVRVNYLYLNNDELNHIPADNWDVKDMFFTTVRADWID